MTRGFAIIALTTALALVACGNPEDLGTNAPPRARLSAPLNAPVNADVTFDASSSFDPDGTVREFTFSFSDGSQPVTLTTPSISHRFAEEGAYEVAVIVKDNAGALTRATQLVLVRSDATACQATSDCSLGADCREHLCYVTGAGSGMGLADCKDDTECGTGAKCRAGLCLSAASPAN
jgi:hypothetical protein